MQTGRDPFARQTITKYKVTETHGGCKWCGKYRTDRNGKMYLWQYVCEPDSGRDSKITGLFCGIDCCNDYHGQ